MFGSPVGLQPVATDPVSEALDGRVFEGNARNYLGQRTFSHATPIDVSGVDWVVVTDVPRSEAREPLVDFALELGLVLLLVLPAAAVGGVLLANRLTRPIPPVVEAAEAIAAGERDPQIPDLGADEFGDLARRLRGMAKELGRQESEIVDEYEQTRELLLTVLPPRLVDSDGNVTGSGETTDEATVVAVWLELQDDDPDSDTVLELLSTASTVAESIAADLGMERIRRAADHSLFLSGIGADGDGVEDAIRFTRSLVDEVTQLALTEQIRMDVHAGLSTGRVATGMLERGNLSFAAWGSPVRRALAIGALNTDDAVVLDRTTAERAQAMGFEPQPAGERVSLDGEPIQVYVLD